MNVDFLQVFNIVAKAAKPIHSSFNVAKSLNDKLIDLQLDSLDNLVMGMYLFELYGIDEEKGQECHPETVNEYYIFLMEHKTTEPKSIEEIKEQIQ